MENITTSIEDLIRKHLPEHECNVIRNVFNENEQLKKKLADKEISIKSYQDNLKSLQDKVNEYQKLESKFQDLERKEQDVKQREEKLTVELLKTQLQEAEKRADLSREYIGLVFKSPVYRKNITGITHGEYVNGYYCNTGFSPTNEETFED